MRWLFALLIAVSCWAGAASGNRLLPPHPTSSGMVFFALSSIHSDDHCANQTLSPFQVLSANLRLENPNNSIRSHWRLMGIPVKKNAIKNRLSAAQFTGSANPLLLSHIEPIAYFALSHSQRADDIYKQPRQSQSLVNYSNWIFHASTQQNRVSGWKESNTQYSGMLTYHNHDAMTFRFS